MWGSFEIRNQRLISTMLQQFAKEPLSENLDKFETWAREFEKLPLYFLKFHGQQSIELVMEVRRLFTLWEHVREKQVFGNFLLFWVRLSNKRLMFTIYVTS